jgi:hypothetical protein
MGVVIVVGVPLIIDVVTISARYSAFDPIHFNVPFVFVRLFVSDPTDLGKVFSVTVASPHYSRSG